MTSTTKSENINITPKKQKLSWWKTCFNFKTAKTNSSSSVSKKDILGLDKITADFMKKYKKTLESLANK